MGNRDRRQIGWASVILSWTIVTGFWFTGAAGPALACSPPSPALTVTALPEGAVVLVGTTGDRVEGGRLFYVESAYAGNIPRSPIVIAFKEGKPVGDCSYPMSSGVRLVIAPYQEADGSLHADLATLQADPGSTLGRAFIAQARERYGDGVVPAGTTAPIPAVPGGGLHLAIAAMAGASAIGVWMLLRRRRRRGVTGSRPTRASTRPPR